MSNKSVIVTGGGTGGHLMPAIAICEALKEDGVKAILITDSRCKSYIPKDINIQYYIIDLKRPGTSFGILKFIPSLLRSIFYVISIMREHNAKIVVGCGGYSSLPILISAILYRKKLVLHEQNSVIGKANYWFSYFANKLFLSFIHTINLPLIKSKKIIWTGIPVTKIHQDNISITTRDNNDEYRILVTGGSQAASIFDEILPETLQIVKNRHKEINLSIIQQAKTKDIKELENKYKNYGINSEISNFFPDIAEKYIKANLLIARAGAGTISEIINYQIPSILIPYPYATSNHQFLNASNLEKFGACKMIEQKFLTPELLAENIINFIEDNSKSLLLSAKLNSMKINSKKIIAKEIEKIIDKYS